VPTGWISTGSTSGYACIHTPRMDDLDVPTCHRECDRPVVRAKRLAEWRPCFADRVRRQKSVMPALRPASRDQRRGWLVALPRPPPTAGGHRLAPFSPSGLEPGRGRPRNSGRKHTQATGRLPEPSCPSLPAAREVTGSAFHTARSAALLCSRQTAAGAGDKRQRP
jgi:hypothetical protein